MPDRSGTPDPSSGDPRGYRKDRILGGVASGLFSVALGIVSVAVPLLALSTGYDATQVGILVALSAVSQLLTRSMMARMMRRLPDKFFVVSAAALIAVSSGMLALSTTIFAFLAAQLLQGAARAFFFTGNQTHAVRVSSSAVKGLTTVNLAGGVGALLGPALAGLLAESSAQTALAVAVVLGAVTAIPAWLLLRLPPFDEDERGSGRIFRRPGVGSACWAGATSGSWRGLLDSYVPVALALAGQSASTIGLLVSVANGAALIGSGLAGWVRRAGVHGSLVIGILATGVGTAFLGAVAGSMIAAACALAISGFGAGLLQTIGPATATEAVHPEERGDAIASVGLFRASALFGAPLGMAGMVLIAPVSVAFLVVGALVSVPMFLAWPKRT